MEDLRLVPNTYRQYLTEKQGMCLLKKHWLWTIAKLNSKQWSLAHQKRKRNNTKRQIKSEINDIMWFIQ